MKVVKAGEELLPATELARRLKRSTGMVAKWVRLGLLKPAGSLTWVGRRSTPGYRLADGLALSAKAGRVASKAKDDALQLAGNSFPEAPEPTQTEPGSEARIRVYEWRVANGYAVFRAGDKVRKPQRGEFS